MAYFAEINGDGTVLRVLVVHDDEQHRGEAFLRDDLGLAGKWVQTSYEGTFRGRAAMVEGGYDAAKDRFVNRRPYAKWKLNKATGEWGPPIPYPQAAGVWLWDDEKAGWTRHSDEGNVP